jgi:hypothetical protein
VLPKSKPEGLTFGSSGYATARDLVAELFDAKGRTKRLPAIRDALRPHLI